MTERQCRVKPYARRISTSPATTNIPAAHKKNNTTTTQGAGSHDSKRLIIASRKLADLSSQRDINT